MKQDPLGVGNQLARIFFESQPKQPKRLTKPGQRLQKAIRSTGRIPGYTPPRYNVTVSHSHRLVWFRVAKVGSTTILETLRESEVTLDLDQFFGIHVPRVLTPGYTRAAFVRDPIERFVSAWRNKVVKWNYLKLDDDLYTECQADISAFIDWFETQDHRTCDPHFRLQSALVPNAHLDLLGRMETFDDDLDRLFDMIGATRTERLRNNAAGSRPPELAPADRARLASIYAPDLIRFGYTA